MFIVLRLPLITRRHFNVISSTTKSFSDMLHGSVVYRMPGKCGKVKKRRRDDKEEAFKSDNNDKGNVNDRRGKIENEDCAVEKKKKKVEKSNGAIKIISWNVAGIRAWIKVNFILKHLIKLILFYKISRTRSFSYHLTVKILGYTSRI